MPHTCDVCEKVFKQKGHYDSHKARKRPCVKSDTIEKLVEKKVQEALANVIVPTVAVERTVAAIPVKAIEIPKPFLKWVGGKTQIIEEVLSHFPSSIHNYHEPFLGGGSVLLAFLAYKQAGRICMSGTVYASDLNSNLIGLYKQIQSNCEAFLTELKALTAEFATVQGTVVNRTATSREEALTSQESYFFWIRSRFNALSKEERASTHGAALLLFLNKTCFRGVYREGPRGFNVPFGNYKNPSIFEEEHIRSLSTLIKDVVFTCRPFQAAFTGMTTDDFTYLDPPYAPEQTNSFVGYTSDGFDVGNHKALFELTGALKNRGVGFLMSNANVKLVQEAFPSSLYTTKVISCRRAIHSKEPDARTNEVLIQQG